MRTWAALLILISVTVLVYLNSFQGIFLFDDLQNIFYNPKIHSLHWPWTFFEDTRRPFLYLTLALNYAVGGADPYTYHLANVFIHTLAGILLFFIIRALEKRHDLKNDFAALSIALLWLVHPLQTESVTYVIQRAESLAGLFYLAAFYAALRYWKKEENFWLVVTGGCAVLGVLTKETVLTLPLLLLLYDAAFVSGTFTKALSVHRKLYLTLAGSWLIFLTFLFTARLNLRPDELFADKGPSWIEYIATQPAVLLQYLKLSIWPEPLVFDYRWPLVKNFYDILGPGLAIILLLGISIWFYRKKSLAGFLAVTFFLILMPSSGGIALQDPIFEHRMYLPLACILGLIVLLYARFSKMILKGQESRLFISALLLITLSATFSILTIKRNKDYYSELAMWQDVVNKRPENERAYHNLGMAYYHLGQTDRAVELYEKAVSLSPRYLNARFALANALYDLGRLRDAIFEYKICLKLNPQFTEGWNNLGDTYSRIGQKKEAREAFEEAIKTNSAYAPAYFNLGLLYAREGNKAASQATFHKAFQLDPSLRF